MDAFTDEAFTNSDFKNEYGAREEPSTPEYIPSITALEECLMEGDLENGVAGLEEFDRFIIEHEKTDSIANKHQLEVLLRSAEFAFKSVKDRSATFKAYEFSQEIIAALLRLRPTEKLSSGILADFFDSSQHNIPIPEGLHNKESLKKAFLSLREFTAD